VFFTVFSLVFNFVVNNLYFGRIHGINTNNYFNKTYFLSYLSAKLNLHSLLGSIIEALTKKFYRKFIEILFFSKYT